MRRQRLLLRWERIEPRTTTGAKARILRGGLRGPEGPLFHGHVATFHGGSYVAIFYEAATITNLFVVISHEQ